MEQVQIPFSPPDITEAEITAVCEALRSGWITTGPKTKQFEKEIAAYVGADRAACLNSATAALELTLRLLGIGSGDEVITSVYTYTASASVICHVGATPVLVDVGKDSFHMEESLLEKAVTEKTKAVIPVDIAGIPCNYERIFAILEAKRNLFQPKSETARQIGRVAVITDAAHAFGASRMGRMVGSIADFTCFSFHAVKNLTTAEGGAVTFSSKDSALLEEQYQFFMLESLHGQSKDALAKTNLGAWEYDIVSPAYKCNMTDLQAALGLAQLGRYGGLLARREEITRRYDAAFAGTEVVPCHHFSADYRSSLHLYLTRLRGKSRTQRDEVIQKLAEQGIAANVHYKPLPLLTAYRNLGYQPDAYPNAMVQFENEVTLPLHTLLTDSQVDYIAEMLLHIL